MLGVLECYGNQLPQLNITGCPMLLNIYRLENRVSHYDTNVESYSGNGQLSFDRTTTIIAPTSVTPPSGPEGTGIAINEANFPDASFRAFVKNAYDSNGDNALTDAEIAWVDSIRVPRKGISSLKGIEYFIALDTLVCDGNNLTTLDVSKNTTLEYLSCAENNLATLDVSKNTALEGLSCYRNNLTTLDISNNSSLSEIECSNNNLTTLNVSKNAVLEELICGKNNLTTLDVNKNTALKKIDCHANNLTKLDVSKNTALEKLNCSSNNLTSLSLGRNSNLFDLDCKNNALSELDIRECIQMVFVYKPEHYMSDYRSYRVGFYEGSSYSYIQLSFDSATTIMTTDSSSQTPDSTAVNATNFPDAYFREYVAYQFDFNEDNALSAVEIARAKYVDVSGEDIASLKLKLTVIDPNVPTGVTINQGTTATLSLSGNKTLQLNATAQCPSGTPSTTYKWTTSNKKIATVNSKTGLVTAKKAGKVKITVTTGNKKKATITVTVTK